MDAFEQRKAEAESIVTQFLERYAPPRGVQEDGLIAIAKGIAEAFAKRLPVDGYREAMQKTLEAVANSHKATSWPAQGVFVDAMPRSSKASFAPVQQERLNSIEVAAQMMQIGAPVAERYLWGRLSSLLIQNGANHEALDRYRETSVSKHKAAYRHDAQPFMLAKYGSEVLRYFSERR